MDIRHNVYVKGSYNMSGIGELIICQGEGD